MGDSLFQPSEDGIGPFRFALGFCLTVSRHGRVGDGSATRSVAARPRTPSIVRPISLAIVAKVCLAATRRRSSASASSVQRRPFPVVT